MSGVQFCGALSTNLVESYLPDDASFWRNVQEPSTRVKDPALLGRLACISFDLFSDRYIRAAALTCILYRGVEGAFSSGAEALSHVSYFSQVVAALSPNESRKDCRWFVSLHLARAAYSLSSGRAVDALGDLSSCYDLKDLAFSYGQVFTNIVKSVLLKVVVSAASGQDVRNVLADVDGILQKSNSVPENYRFLNKWAYEEVAFVYSMLCELYKWRIIVLNSNACLSLVDLEQAGFRWRFVGTPFGKFFQP